jgi:prepilin-type processing-associated H-X9-DG protein
VTVAIISLLVGVLLPAIMSARETARCLQCSCNLRDIGLAIHQFHDTAQRLPAAWSEVPDELSGYGWAVDLLPYLEQSDLRKQVNSRLPIAAIENVAARNAQLPIMQCPSDISEPTFELYAERHHQTAEDSAASNATESSEDSLPIVRLPATNYLGVFGTLEADDTYPAPPGDGAIVWGRRVRLADLERGQSHTLIVGERTAAMAPSTWLGVTFRGEDAACRLVGSAMTAPNCEACDECEFASRHSGGANFVWADGHVSLVGGDIDALEYQRLAKRRTN